MKVTQEDLHLLLPGKKAEQCPKKIRAIEAALVKGCNRCGSNAGHKIQVIQAGVKQVSVRVKVKCTTLNSQFVTPNPKPSPGECHRAQHVERKKSKR